MSDASLDYATIRSSVEKKLYRQKWSYRLVFFVMHLLFFAISMLMVWGTVASDAALRTMLIDSRTGAAVVVLVPTIMWAFVLLFHVASLFIESGAGEKAMRQRLFMREVGEDILKGMADEAMLEKPKRRSAALADERALTSDDGELLLGDEEDYETGGKRGGGQN